MFVSTWMLWYYSINVITFTHKFPDIPKQGSLIFNVALHKGCCSIQLSYWTSEKKRVISLSSSVTPSTCT